MKLNFYTDVVLHAAILLLVAGMMIQSNDSQSDAELRHTEWKKHEQAMIEREAQREQFFFRWGKALQNAECEATVIEAIKEVGSR